MQKKFNLFMSALVSSAMLFSVLPFGIVSSTSYAAEMSEELNTQGSYVETHKFYELEPTDDPNSYNFDEAEPVLITERKVRGRSPKTFTTEAETVGSYILNEVRASFFEGPAPSVDKPVVNEAFKNETEK